MLSSNSGQEVQEPPGVAGLARPLLVALRTAGSAGPTAPIPGLKTHDCVWSSLPALFIIF